MNPTALPEVDYAATSSRPAFASLPDEVRVACGDAVRGVVVDAAPPVGSGFTGAYAGLLTLADGRRVFAKAAGPGLPHVVAGLAAEERILPRLAGLRCPSRLAGVAEVPTAEGSWRVLLVEEIDGRQPGAPWTAADADAAVSACLEVAALDGEALVHGDVRPDNLLVETGGSARVVDWNHPTLGAPWVDLVGLWPLMAHHGVDVRRFAEVPVLAGVTDAEIDAFLAVLAGFMVCDVDAPPPPGCTPALRRHQLLMAGATVELLGARRGW